MSTTESVKQIEDGKCCPWCWHKFSSEDKPLRHNETGKRYCDRNCYELDVKYPALEK